MVDAETLARIERLETLVRMIVDRQVNVNLISEIEMEQNNSGAICRDYTTMSQRIHECSTDSN